MGFRWVSGGWQGGIFIPSGLFGKLADGLKDFFPAGAGGLLSAQFQAALAGGLRHVVSQVGLVGHFGGVVDEIPLVVAEPACLAMVYHLPPAAAVVHDEDAAGGHGLEADAGPVLGGIGGLEDDLAVAVEVLLGDFRLVAGGAYPGVGGADFIPALVAEAEEEAALENGGYKVFIDMECVPGEFIRVLPGDASAAEPLIRAVGDVGEGVVMEVGPEGHEADGGVSVEGPQQGHVVLPDFFVLVEEEGDLAVFHEFFFSGEEPGHAVDEDGFFGPLADLGQVFQEFGVAEAQDGVIRLQHGPVAGGVDDDAQLDHFQVEAFVAVAVAGGDEVDFHSHFSPKEDLMVEFRSGSAVQGGEAVDKEAFQGGVHSVSGYKTDFFFIPYAFVWTMGKI